MHIFEVPHKLLIHVQVDYPLLDANTEAYDAQIQTNSQILHTHTRRINRKIGIDAKL